MRSMYLTTAGHVRPLYVKTKCNSFLTTERRGVLNAAVVSLRADPPLLFDSRAQGFRRKKIVIGILFFGKISFLTKPRNLYACIKHSFYIYILYLVVAQVKSLSYNNYLNNKRRCSGRRLVCLSFFILNSHKTTAVSIILMYYILILRNKYFTISICCEIHNKKHYKIINIYTYIYNQ